MRLSYFLRLIVAIAVLGFLIDFMSSISSIEAKPQVSGEVIHRYDSQITIETDGSLYITETIEVTAEGRDIKRGIYRDFPLVRRTFLGGALPMYYRIESVKRDGQIEPYHTEKMESVLRLYIGDRDVYLPTGKRYTYEITYSIGGQVFYYADYDELNWNVIGTAWSFPIETARAEFYLPENAPVLEYSAYTGKVISKGKDYTARREPGVLSVEITKPLAAHEGLTVALSFPKGVVRQYANMTGEVFFWRQHPGLKIMLFGLCAMLVYYFVAWNHVGRDPKKRSLTPFYSPPEGISPAMAAYIMSMGGSSREKNMTSAILSLAAKGYLTIEDMGRGRFMLTRANKTKAHNSDEIMSEDEKIVYDHVKTNLTISSRSEALVKTAREHEKTLDKLCRKRYFFINFWWAAGGFIPLVASMILISFEPKIDVEMLWFGLTFLIAFGGVSLGVMIYAVGQLISGPLSRKGNAVFLIIWASFFSMGGFMGLGMMMSGTISWFVLTIILVMVGIIAIMFRLMKAPTVKGRYIMDQIAGLKYYMESVEERILQKFDPPQMSRELYEKYLPYAVALGVESKWGDKFALATAGAVTATATMNTTPHWFHSRSGYSSGGFSASNMVSSLGSSISAASTSHSSGGGGSVGGGGGGGGGGGW